MPLERNDRVRLVQQGQENDVKMQNEMLCKKQKCFHEFMKKQVDGSPLYFFFHSEPIIDR